MKKLLLTAAAVAAVAVCAPAQTVLKPMACTDFVLSATAAEGTGTLSYQWYSGPTAEACTTAIAGCATQNCTIPAANAINTVVYKRTVVSSECPTEVKQTTVTVQYQGLKLGTRKRGQHRQVGTKGGRLRRPVPVQPQHGVERR
jgi:hypothetical protein